MSKANSTDGGADLQHLSKTATFFDTPFRSTQEEIEKLRSKISGQALLQQILDGMPNPAVLLDSNRQIVSFNKRAKDTLLTHPDGTLYGLRVGEALHCKHAFEMHAGCGTSKFCKECGAGKCNKITNEAKQNYSEECRITVLRDNTESSLDFRVHTSILKVDDEDFTLFTIEDIQDEKRRGLLEKIFFHDVLNTAANVRSLAFLINDSENDNETDTYLNMLQISSEQLINEIQAQRDLLNAEKGELSVNIQSVSINEVVSSVYNLYKNHKLNRNKEYFCDYLSEDMHIKTDNTLLIRSLGNLIKNALEATEEGDKVRLSVFQKNGNIEFSVYNNTFMSDQVRLQIFQRSFSTKSKSGRGIGTYSVKILVEQYLKGKVSFISNEKNGTTFKIILPIEFS